MSSERKVTCDAPISFYEGNLPDELFCCFRERFENFLNELEKKINTELPGKNIRKRLAVKHVTLEEIMKHVTKEKGIAYKCLKSLAGFDIEGNGKLPPYKPRKVEIDGSSVAYECTDESIPSSI